MGKVKMAKCPICEETFELLADAYVGATIQCPGCYTDLKIVRLGPVEVEEVDRAAGHNYYEEEDEEDTDSEDEEKLFGGEEKEL